MAGTVSLNQSRTFAVQHLTPQFAPRYRWSGAVQRTKNGRYFGSYLPVSDDDTEHFLKMPVHGMAIIDNWGTVRLLLARFWQRLSVSQTPQKCQHCRPNSKPYAPASDLSAFSGSVKPLTLQYRVNRMLAPGARVFYGLLELHSQTQIRPRVHTEAPPLPLVL